LVVKSVDLMKTLVRQNFYYRVYLFNYILQSKYSHENIKNLPRQNTKEIKLNDDSDVFLE